MTKTSTIKVKSIKNEEIIMAIPIINMIITKVIITTIIIIMLMMII